MLFLVSDIASPRQNNTISCGWRNSLLSSECFASFISVLVTDSNLVNYLASAFRCFPLISWFSLSFKGFSGEFYSWFIRYPLHLWLRYFYAHVAWVGLPTWISRKELACSAGDMGSITGSGRSPGGRHGNLFQYSCWENPMNREAWHAAVHGVAKSRTRLSYWTVMLSSNKKSGVRE